MRHASRGRTREAGFALSSEVLLIAVILICGLIGGWAKFRDQSSAEILDAISAIDAFIAGTAPQVQPYAQQWITDNGVGCDSDGLPAQPAPPATCGSAVTEVIDPGGTPFVPSGAITLQYRAGSISSTSTVHWEQDVLF